MQENIKSLLEKNEYECRPFNTLVFYNGKTCNTSMAISRYGEDCFIIAIVDGAILIFGVSGYLLYEIPQDKDYIMLFELGFFLGERSFVYG